MPDIHLEELLRHFPIAEGENNPRFNIFAWREEGRLFIIFIPRSKHRPDCFFAEGNDQCLISPGALDMAGLIVTPREEDFHKITTTDIENIICEVGFSKGEAMNIARKIKFDLNP